MSDDDGRQSGDAQLFAIFAFTILSLILVPVTWWRVSSGGGASDTVVQPWQKDTSSRKTLGSRVRGLVNTVNICLLLAWLVAIGLALYIATMSPSDNEPFDPFKILGITETEDTSVIKKAYRNLSRIYHPDKNPDPKAAEYFATKITKAYQALTDETSRANFIKYGHPDGPQAMHIGVALPQFLFISNKRTAPLMLLALSFCGLAVPILAISCYLWTSEGVVGPNQVMETTLMFYHRYAVKELMRVTKIAEAIVVANEYILIGFNRETGPAFQRFMTAMGRTYSLGKDKKLPNWWQPQMMRSYLFLVAYLDRNDEIVPVELSKDYNETLRLAYVLCEEFVKAATAPRNRQNQGWFVPAESAVQFQQCLVQRVRPEVLAPSVDDKKKKKTVTGESAAALMQLPGVDEDVVRNLEKKSKVKSLEDLTAMTDDECKAALEAAGVKHHVYPDIKKSLLSLPQAHITGVKVYVDGEDDIKESDVVTVEIYLALTRASHGGEDVDASKFTKARKPVQAYAPRYPHPVTEKWYVFVAEPKASTPVTWCNSQLELLEAESEGFKQFTQLGCKWGTSAAGRLTGGNGTVPANGASTSASEDDQEETKLVGQKVEFKFLAWEAGKHDLQIVVMPSCWLGCNTVKPLTVTVLKQTSADRKKGPGNRGPKQNPLEEDEMEEEQKAQKKTSDSDDDADSDNASDDGEGDDDDDGWDTDETGTDISHESEDEADPLLPGETAKTK